MENLNNIWGNVLNYKGIKIYPIAMEECDEFYNYVNCLMYEKNNCPDVNIIRMYYLDFLFLIGREMPNVLEKLEKLFKLVLKEQTITIKLKDNLIVLIIEDIEVNGNDFDNIKKIIFNQNLMRISDEIVSEEFKEALNNSQEFFEKKNPPATLEERITAYRVAMKIPYKEIKELTIYQFNKDLERLNIYESWKVYSYPAIKSGESEKIQHWLSHIPEKGLYDDYIMSAEEFNKMTSDTGIFSNV